MTTSSANLLFAVLTGLLDDLEGVQQDPVFHPEGDALFHSLQVWQHAHHASDDPELWAAALLHDVGKGLDGDHEHEGVELLRGLMPDRVLWLVEHHLDLLRKRTRRRWRGSDQLRDLEKLRRWDVAGRDPDAQAVPIGVAVQSILEVALLQS